MKSNSALIFVAILLFLMPLASAGLSIVDSAGTDITQIAKTAVHGTSISLPIFYVKNTETTNIMNITMTIGTITSPSTPISVPVNDSSKTTITTNSTTNYTISPYSIPQYLGAGTYTVPINVSGVNATNASFSDTINAVITVNESKSLSVSTTSVSASSSPGKSINATFTLANNGNTNITNIAFTQSSVLQDGDNDTIALSTTADKSLSILQPSQSAIITIAASPSSNIDVGSYSTNIVANSTEGVSATVSYTIGITQAFCEKGKAGGYFEIDITEPDSGDDFYPNEIIPIEVKVRNTNDDERDVVIVANLFDATDNEFLDEEIETDGTVGDNSYEYFTLDLKVPVDVKDTHSYRVYAKAYEDGDEDKQCVDSYVSIDIKKETHSIVIDKVELPSSVSCDNTFDAKVTLANLGKRDEDAKVKIYNSELKINEEKTLTIDKEDKKSVTISAHIPKDATQGNHSLKIDAFFHLSNDNYGNSVTKTVALDVEGSCIVEEPNIALTTELLDTAYAGEQITIKLNLFNTGDKKAAYSVTASGYEAWATLNKIDPMTVTLDPSQTASAYIYLTALNTSGSKNFKVNVLYGDKKFEKDISLELKEKISAPKAYQGLVSKLSNIAGVDLVTVNIVLVIGVILVLMWIIRVRRSY